MAIAIRLQRSTGGALEAGAGHALWMHKIAINVILACDILYTSRLYRIGGLPVQPVLLGATALVCIFYGGLLILRGRILPIAILSICVFLIFNQINEFSKISNTEVLINSAFQYIWIPTFSVFYISFRNGLSLYIFRSMYFYAIMYCFVYAIISLLYHSGIIPRVLFIPVLATDVERGDRIFNYAAATTFAWFVCLWRARSSPNLKHLVLVCICALVIALTLSRVYIFCLFILTCAYMVKLNMRTISIVCLMMLWIPNLIYIYGMFDDRWNPFLLFSGDTSGSVRAAEYQTARLLLDQHPIFGIGIVPTARDGGLLTGNEFFSGSDLGALGVWLDFGLLGLIMFFVGSHVVCRPIRTVGGDFAWPLFLTGCLLGAYGCIAPVIFYSAGATYFAILLGLMLASLNGSRRLSVPRIA